MLVSSLVVGFPEDSPSENSSLSKRYFSGGFFSGFSFRILFLTFFLSYLNMVYTQPSLGWGFLPVRKSLLRYETGFPPHNQSGWVKSGLAGHTGESGRYLGTTTTGAFRILRERLPLGVPGGVPCHLLECTVWRRRDLGGLNWLRTGCIFGLRSLFRLCSLTWSSHGCPGQ